VIAAEMTVVRDRSSQSPTSVLAGIPWALAVLLAGFCMLALPTLVANAKQSWGSEQGEQGPIVLAIGLWLIWRAWPSIRRVAVPGAPAISVAAFAVAGALYVIGRVWDQFEVESYGLYGLTLSGLYAMVGAPGLRQGWFPLAYLIFALPPPYSMTWFLTNHLRILVTEAAVGLFQQLGFSVVRDGLNILIDQYNLAVQDACSGMNSLFSLTAIGLVYVYLRRGSNWWYLAAMMPPIIAFAIVGNFVRVVALIALTHYFGDAVAQSFLHQGAGFLTFFAAMLCVFVFEMLAARFVSGKHQGKAKLGSDELGVG
jgi:exosortase